MSKFHGEHSLRQDKMWLHAPRLGSGPWNLGAAAEWEKAVGQEGGNLKRLHSCPAVPSHMC